jgi:hypothetical protein
MVVFRARDFPALPAVRASLLDGTEGVVGSSPTEGSPKGLQIGRFLLPSWMRQRGQGNAEGTSDPLCITEGLMTLGSRSDLVVQWRIDS